MKVALDTNSYSNAGRGNASAVEILKRADQIFLPFIVLAELRAGFACGTSGKQNEARLTEFLNSPRVSLLFADEQTTHHYARVFSQLKTQGTPVPTNDIWIAALVLQHDLLLFSNDIHFAKIPQLLRV